MEQFVVLLVIAAISFINWLIKKSAEQRERRRQEMARSIPREVPESSEPPVWQAPDADLRKFMEALGLPPDQAPAPVERWEPPAAEVVPVEPAPAPLPPPLPVYHAPKISRPSEEALRLARRLEAREPGVEPAGFGAPVRFREMLRSREGLREAVILNEVLSPPKGLQPF